MKIRVLSEADCRAVLDMASAIELQAQAFAILSQGRALEGLRSFARSDNPPGIAIFNPCVLRDGAGYGIKIVSDFYGNDERGVARMSGLVCLFDGQTGHPQAVLEGGYLTDLRTGAGTALAARHLARGKSKVVALIGAGRVARNQLAALAEIFDLEAVFLLARSSARAADFIRSMLGAGGRIPRDIRVAGSPERAVSEADIVVAATTSHVPVLRGDWLRAGTFVAAVGAHIATAREVDSETIRRASRVVIDSRTDCLDAAGDLIVPLAEGIIGRDDIAEIAEIASGARPGRQSDEEITFYKSIGVPIQDLVTAQHMVQRAAQAGLGTEIEIGGDAH
ncbi:MAG: ornithine cyclodeaminase family protein [Alphaproteobacteria bacterium]|jgi:ornithine cyclodeaminase/alanine dehydrogenase-like protein (mu-crystallin family)|nr:MAG: ornithine cyclodeaminase family protein [Alphaproteobacteria bacterium]